MRSSNIGHLKLAIDNANPTNTLKIVMIETGHNHIVVLKIKERKTGKAEYYVDTGN
jgi:hypothetical protein